jgi:ElaB/YqjD/DUF883 family membrane-anchored ribosome-binding protein
MKTMLNDIKNTDIANRIVDAVAPAVQGTANRVVETTQTLAQAAADGLDKLSDRRQAALGACRDTVLAHPVGALGVAVLAGLLLGALMRK